MANASLEPAFATLFEYREIAMTAFDYVAVVIGVIILTVIIGGPPLLAGRAARARGRDPEVWQLLCVIVPVIPYLYLLSIPTLRELEEEEDPAEMP